MVNPELKIAPSVNFPTVNIGSDAPRIGVADGEKREGVMAVTGMALGTPLHSTVANMPHCLIIVEVPKGRMEGIHSVASQNLVSGTLVLMVGDACNVTGVLDGLQKISDKKGLTTIRIACVFLCFSVFLFFCSRRHNNTRWVSLSSG